MRPSPELLMGLAPWSSFQQHQKSLQESVSSTESINIADPQNQSSSNEGDHETEIGKAAVTIPIHLRISSWFTNCLYCSTECSSTTED